MIILSEEQRTRIMLAIIDLAKERMKEVNHLEVGNYCRDAYVKIIKMIENGEYY